MNFEKVAFLVAILLSHFIGYTQIDTNFINELGVQVQRSEAKYYRVFDTINFILKDYDLNHTLRRMETCSGKTFTIRQGKATYYHHNGKISHEGEYVKGIKTEEWNYYTLSGKKLRHKEIYEADLKVLHFFYDTISGFMTEKGRVDKDNYKTGEWTQYHFRSESVKWKNNYVGGKIHGEQVQYYAEGATKRIEHYKSGKQVKAKLFSPEGKKIKYYPEYQYPFVKFSIPTYLKAQCPCVEPLLKLENIELKCLISEKGEASQWEVNCTKDEVCKQDMLNAFKKIRNWRPARFEGVAKESWYKYTMRFYAPRE